MPSTLENTMAGSNLYSVENYAEGYPDGIEFHYWQVARNQILNSILKGLPGGAGKILEIGCGRGFNVQFLRAHGFDCWGTELGPAPIVAGVKGYAFSNQDAFTLDATANIKIGADVQTILLLDVIEHIQDAPGFLKQVREHFPKLRHLILMVPARQEIWSNHDEHYGHFRRYDLTMLKLHAEGAGFQQIWARYLFKSLYLAARALLQVKKERDVLIRGPKPAMRALHALIARFLVLESWLLPSAMKGSSAISVCRVPEAQS